MFSAETDADLLLTNTYVTVAGVSNLIDGFERGMLIGGPSANVLDASV